MAENVPRRGLHRANEGGQVGKRAAELEPDRQPAEVQDDVGTGRVHKKNAHCDHLTRGQALPLFLFRWLCFPAAAHTEAGWMAGVGMRVIVFIPEMVEPEFMYKLFNVVTGDLDTLIKCI